MEMVGRRIADPRILRLIRKWLNAGIVEEGKWVGTEKGTQQGAVISPLLANIYLLVLDQWTESMERRRRGATWSSCATRTMPSLVSTLSPRKADSRHEHEAEKFLKDLREQLGRYGLELNEEKTRLIRFGRFARHNREERGEGKPESFTFPGLKKNCGRTGRSA
jgi:RNA-directed DNA polymerase